MNRTSIIAAAIIVTAGSMALVASSLLPSQQLSLDAPVTIPFELVKKHIVLPVTVGGGKPLSFVLDTGNKYAVIDLDKAKALGLSFGHSIEVRGTGESSSGGAAIRDASFGVVGLDGFSQPLQLAIPLKSLALRLGHDFDGILGADFIEQFVVEIDYKARLLRLHDATKFSYSGGGETIPIRYRAGHPIVKATITPAGGKPIEGELMLDIGAEALTLHAPFVEKHQLPGAGQKTIRTIGQGGAGGKSTGVTGRLDAFTIGRFTLRDPITVFSHDRAGAFAEESIQGNIGASVIRNFRVFLDYRRDRIILEPNPAFPEISDRAFSGLSLEALGADYKTFRVTDVLENSPALEAGFKAGDIIVSIDGSDASSITLSQLFERLERPAHFELVVRRGDETLKMQLTTRTLGQLQGTAPGS